MAETTLLRQATKDTVGVTLVTRNKPVRAREFKARLLMSECGGGPAHLFMTSITPIAQRIHVGVGVAGNALHRFRAQCSFGVMTGLTCEEVVFAPEGIFAKIMKLARSFKT